MQYGIRDNQSNANNLQLVVVFVVVLQEGKGEVQDGWRQSKVYYVHAREIHTIGGLYIIYPLVGTRQSV